MSALRDLQAQFAAALAGDEAALTGAIKPRPGVSAAAQIAIYRNNVEGAVRRAMAALYPAVQALVGEDFFAAMIGDYLRHEVPSHGRMGEYGHRLPEFLEGYPPAAGYPYFADVARLELASYQAYVAADAAALAPEDLSGIAPEDAVALRFDLHPAVRLVASAHPILTIYEIARAPQDEAVRLPEEGERVLVARRGEDVEMQRLAAGEFALLASLDAGAALGAAATAAEASQGDFDLQATLAKALRRGLFSGARLASDNTHDEEE